MTPPKKLLADFRKYRTPHNLHAPSLQDLACVHTGLGSEASHAMNDRRVPRLRLEVPGKRPRACISIATGNLQVLKSGDTYPRHEASSFKS